MPLPRPPSRQHPAVGCTSPRAPRCTSAHDEPLRLASMRLAPKHPHTRSDSGRTARRVQSSTTRTLRERHSLYIERARQQSRSRPSSRRAYTPRVFLYLPMQKSRKMTSSRSSTSTLPVMRPSSEEAVRSSSHARSRGVCACGASDGVYGSRQQGAAAGLATRGLGEVERVRRWKPAVPRDVWGAVDVYSGADRVPFVYERLSRPV